MQKEDGKIFLRLQPPKPGQMVMAYRQVGLPTPLPPALEIRLRLRYTDVKSGEKAWNDARISEGSYLLVRSHRLRWHADPKVRRVC